MTESPSNPRPFKTESLTMATFLSYSGELYRLVAGKDTEGKRKAIWEFHGSQVAGLVATYKTNKVAGPWSPATFHNRINKVRTTMFDFLKAEDAPATWGEEKTKTVEESPSPRRT